MLYDSPSTATDSGTYGYEPDRRFTVGIIGAGDIARSAHVPTLRAMRCAEVAWITDIDAGRAGSIARACKLPFEPLPKNLKDLPAADVVLITTPYGVREPYYQALRERNCSIYVEKPFAQATEEHRRICSWFPGYALTAGLMMRCWGANQMVREAVTARLFGPLRAVRFGFGRPGLVTNNRFYLDKKKGGGGMVAELGIHGIDALLFVTRTVTASVEDVRVIWDGDLDAHTDARLMLHTEHGDKVACRITVTAIEETMEGLELEFDHAVVSYLLPGQGYALHGDTIDMSVNVRPARSATSYTLQPARHQLMPSTKFQMFYDYWRRFLLGVHTGQPNWTTAESALLTTQVMEQIREAGQQ